MPVRNSKSVWTGKLKQGKGSIALGSGNFEEGYSFASRFEQGSLSESLLSTVLHPLVISGISGTMAQQGS